MMVVAKDDLGLSLGLGLSSSSPTAAAATTTTTTNHRNNNNNNNQSGFMMMINQNRHQTSLFSNNNTTTATATTSSPFNLNLLTPSTAVAAGGSSFLHKLQRNLSSDSFPTSDRNSDTCRLFLRGIDVNRPAGGSAAAAAADEDDAGVSSPNSTVSTVSGKRSLGERDSAGAGDDLDAERASSRGLSDDEDGGENSRKKLRLSKDQSAILEESFKEHNTLNPKQKLALAKRLGLRPRQVEVWFQNRRARTKLKQTEVDCEFLKRCCEQLTEENRRLQKEVQELRTLKMSPQFYMQMTPPTTLTMCPSCERVAVPPSAQPKPKPVPVNSWVTTPGPVRPFARS